MRVLTMGHIAFELALIAPIALAQLVTSPYDNLRTGATLNEKTLTPQNVNANQFGRLGAFRVDGAVYAQPLVVPSLDIPGKGRHNVLFVSTEHDSVYAFDADRSNDPPLWHVSFVDHKRGVTTVPSRDVECPFIQPEVGITPTPVIDLKSGALYVLSPTMIRHTLGNNEYFQQLHALGITTGAEKLDGPKRITASVPGRGAGTMRGKVQFDPLRENPRAALLLVNNTVYAAWG
jgi:hypothetical protein